MYIPKHYSIQEKKEIIAFMQTYSFATIITSNNNIPVATHLPFVVAEKNEKIILSSHFAKANKQWEDLKENKVLVIFSEPHAYISPKHYESELNVPTWNYISVHAYGKGKIIENKEDTFLLLEEMINSYEKEYQKQWEKLPNEYKNKMVNAIVGFEIEVIEIQAKSKLSQNKTKKEQENIIKSFSVSSNTNEKTIADFMMKNNTNAEI